MPGQRNDRHAGRHERAPADHAPAMAHDRIDLARRRRHDGPVDRRAARRAKNLPSAELAIASLSRSSDSCSGERLRPDFLEPLDAHRLRGLQLLREQADAQLLEPPAELVEARVARAAPLGELPQVALLERPQLGEARRVARRIGAQLVEPRRDRLQVARQVLQPLPTASSATKRLGTRRSSCCAMSSATSFGGRASLSLRCAACVFGEDDAGERAPPRWRSASAGRGLRRSAARTPRRRSAAARRGRRGRARPRRSARAARRPCRAAGTAIASLLQVGQVLLERLQRVADLQRDQPAQAGAVLVARRPRARRRPRSRRATPLSISAG